MRHMLLAACLALSLAACGAQGTDAAATTDLSPLPATVEGDIYFDLGEASDTGTIAPTETTIASLAIKGADSDSETTIDIQVTGAQLAGLTGDGERVRATLSGKGSSNGAESYQVASLQKL